MVIMTPVTLRQTKSMLAMQRLAPETKKLRQKYGNDRDRLNREMMALYQANNVNPLGGCLPILFQSPVFLGLFYVVQKLSRRVSDIGIGIGDQVTRAAGEITVFADRTYNPEWVDTGSDLYQDLTNTSEMTSFGLDLSQSPSSALGESFVTGLPYLLLVILVGVSSWLQQKTNSRTLSKYDEPSTSCDHENYSIHASHFFIRFSNGIDFYFLTSNIFRVGQQMFITRRFYGDNKVEKEVVVPTAKEMEEREKENLKNSKAQKGAGNHGRRPVTNPPKNAKKSHYQQKHRKRESGRA